MAAQIIWITVFHPQLLYKMCSVRRYVFHVTMLLTVSALRRTSDLSASREANFCSGRRKSISSSDWCLSENILSMFSAVAVYATVYRSAESQSRATAYRHLSIRRPNRNGTQHHSDRGKALSRPIHHLVKSVHTPMQRSRRP